MLAVDRTLSKELPEARMILQVHDELLFEVPESRVDDLERLVRPLMEHAMELSVPLDVSVKAGENWAETERFDA